MMALSFTREYFRIPAVTRVYTTSCVLTTAAVQLEVITPVQLNFNPDFIIRRYQLLPPLAPASSLGPALTVMLVYVWSCRRPLAPVSVCGVLSLRAPLLPWALAGGSLLLGDAVAVDLLGIAVGHLYYFLVVVFPNQPGGRKLLTTPALLRTLFDRPDDRLLRDEKQGDDPH
ncbi:derlin-3 isoform X2 [Pseudoliparis swirei]|uniref:derlin-3 isoform X2 n=1 Tax=Pseudoliparis swirei TaxID=2059687 RepID=UPI0024BED885|nr:derlin-3 isoform X2 [Pseudoliparis swirei]